MPFIILDAIFYAMRPSDAEDEDLVATYQLITPLLASREAESILNKLKVGSITVRRAQCAL